MRKVGLAAMAALLVLGTAQALTIDWEEQVPEGAWVSESLSGPHNNTYYKNGVETSSGSFILRVTFPATLTAKEVIELVRRVGDRADCPDNIYGYGVPDMWKAYQEYLGTARR